MEAQAMATHNFKCLRSLFHFIFFFREEGVEARAMDTHNFSAGPLPDYFEKEFGSLGNASHPYNGSLHALEFQCVFTTSLLHIFTTSVFTTYY